MRATRSDTGAGSGILEYDLPLVIAGRHVQLIAVYVQAIVRVAYGFAGCSQARRFTAAREKVNSELLPRF